MSGKMKSADSVLVLLGVLVFAALLATVIRQALAPQRSSALAPGEKAPPIEAAGWVNGPALTSESFSGKLVVIDAWATWCVPCRLAAPKMVATYNRFRDRGVVFIGLTREEADSLPQIKSFLHDGGITWPNGYGASSTLSALGAEFIPTVWVIDRKGMIVWNSDTGESLDEALEQALAKSE